MATARALEDQVAIVTGGGRGMGLSIALELAARGARILVTGRDERSLGEAVGEIAHSGGQARHLVGDVRDPAHARDAVQRALEAWGRVDIGIANAGVARPTRLGGGDPTALEAARAVLDVDLLGPYLLFDAVAAVLQGPGRLIAISSVLGKVGVAGQAAYCAAKSGLHGLVRAAAVELGPRKITCNAVCPGWVDTEMARQRFVDIAAERGSTPQAVERSFRDETPIRRFVESEEVAGLVAFLCSPAAAAITGQAISICGGTSAFAG